MVKSLRLEDLGRIGDPPRAVGLQPHHRLRRAVPDPQIVPGAHQTARHARAHMAQADKADVHG